MNFEPLRDIDDPAYELHLDEAIRASENRLRSLEGGRQLPGSPSQLLVILRSLIAIKLDVSSGILPALRERPGKAVLRMFVDGWDQSDRFADQILSVMAYYIHNERITRPDGYRTPEDIGAIIQRRGREIDRLVSQSRAAPPPTDHPLYKSMPHAPDIRSMETYGSAAQDGIDKLTPRLADLRRAKDGHSLATLGHQHLARALVGYFRRDADLADVARGLRLGLDLIHEAIGLGHAPNAWETWDLVLFALALRHPGLVATLRGRIERQHQDTRIRPVHWLIAGIATCLHLAAGDEAAARRSLDEHRIGLFVDKLPEELNDQVPELKTFHHLLRALVERKQEDFNHYLAERMTIRAAWFKRSLAPIALCDLHALGLCRMARDRGLDLDVDHLYLPIGLLTEADAQAHGGSTGS